MYVGDFEHANPVALSFYTYRIDQGLTTVAQFQNAARNGPPEFAIQEVNSGNRITAGMTIILNTTLPEVGQVPGRHRLIWDPSTGNGYQIGVEYELVCTDGSIDRDGTGQWTDISNQRVMLLPLQTRTSGIMLDRAVKVMEATVFDAGDLRSEFVIEGTGLNTAPNFYELQNISWQPGQSLNYGAGYVVQRSEDAGSGRVRIFLQRMTQANIQDGDKCVFLPEERPSEQYWANIIPEFGPTDEYSLRWYNGTVETKPDDDLCFLTVKQVSASIPPKLDNVLMNQMEAGSKVFTYTATLGSQFIGANEKADITVTATIDGRQRVYNRIYPNAAN